ncbi:MAG: SDR family oxidoreductase [Deltaproteobacteria bacterium]|nr:SDR family oxidoreductase [Deltaproteobacteria bacterium]
MSVVVTGSNGLLGSSLVAHFGAAKKPLIGIDLGSSSNQHLGAHEYYDCDLSNYDQVTELIERLHPRVIMHGAAMTNVDGCEAQREAAWRVNVEATAHLAALSETLGAHLIYVSTDYVFDGRSGSYDETSLLSPLGIYALTKAAGELSVRTHASQWAICRTSVPFGPFTHVKKDFVRWLRDELTAKKPVRIVTDQISNPTYAPDLARMLVQVADTGYTGVLHTAGATSLSRFELATTIAKTFGLDAALIQPIKTADLRQASPRPLDGSLSVHKARSLGFQPKTIDEALAILKAVK